MRRTLHIIVAASLLAAFATTAGAQPAKTDGGLIEGTATNGVTAYKGIPFAAAPVGDLRWRAPQPPAPWQGVRKADAFGPACPQDQSFNKFIGLPELPTSEDCLYLNVWTPAKSSGAKLPVMVWIYGGGFTGGATGLPTYDGAHLASKGVVLVSIGYRIGALGYLAHPELDAESGGHGSGTYGLMDQIAGLKWVQKNIAAFGGDPAKVTIFGESAGGYSVSMLAYSPKARGLFARVIAESGANFHPPKVTADEGGVSAPALALAEKQGTDFLGKIGAKSIAEARKVSPAAIMKAQGPELGAFWPALDGNVLPGDEYVAYEHGAYNDTPALIGTNEDEGAVFVRQATVDEYTRMVKAQYGNKASAILAAYPAMTDAQALRAQRDLFADTAFVWPTYAWAHLQSANGKSAVFEYRWTHRPPNYDKFPMLKDVKASHGSEIDYVFGNGDKSWTDSDRKISDELETYWIDFAKTGDPNGGGLPTWPAYTDAKPAVMKLDVTPEPIALPEMSRIKALDDYYAWRREQAK